MFVKVLKVTLIPTRILRSFVYSFISNLFGKILGGIIDCEI